MKNLSLVLLLAGAAFLLKSTSADACDITLRFAVSTEKKAWIPEVNKGFNDIKKTKSGAKICVVPTFSGSPDAIYALGNTADIASPASNVYIDLAKADTSVPSNFVVPNDPSLVISPVVIAMWDRMAYALKNIDADDDEAAKKTWDKDPTISWKAILDLVNNPEGWGAKKHKAWGKFKFGHTHPDYSNSGMASVLAEAYASIGKRNGALTAADVAKPQLASFVKNIEQSVVHYGESTGFFSDQLFKGGPNYLSAAVVYESSVVDYYALKAAGSIANSGMDIVAVYPEEGTFYSDHPMIYSGKLTPAQKEAADIYFAYLKEPAQQKVAMQLGFRPSNTDVEFTAPLDSTHGVNIEFPKTVLQVPPVEVINNLRTVWQQSKKHSHVVVIIDTSGSMEENNRMSAAKTASKVLINTLSPNDLVTLIGFSSQTNWIEKGVKADGAGIKRLRSDINDFLPAGGTKLYNTLESAYDYLQALPEDQAGASINAIVVLTDGDDTANQLTLEQLLKKVGGTAESTAGVKIFTVGVGEGITPEGQDALKKIAAATKAKTYSAKDNDQKAMVKILKEISTFF